MFEVKALTQMINISRNVRNKDVNMRTIEMSRPTRIPDAKYRLKIYNSHFNSLQEEHSVLIGPNIVL